MTWCILINTTPKYMPLVEVEVVCIRRYAKELSDVPIFVATEMSPSEPILSRILELENVHLISLSNDEADFLESRVAAAKYLPDYDIVLPLQDDFWLDRRPDYKALNEAVEIMISDPKVQSIRLMPSPGPHESDVTYKGQWAILSEKDTCRFTLQATLWKRDTYVEFLEAVIKYGSKEYVEYAEYAEYALRYDSWSKFCVGINIAENAKGQALFKELCMSNGTHLSVQREHDGSNAVFLCPWPYRPTAVVQGTLEPWAKEFMVREGFRPNNLQAFSVSNHTTSTEQV